MRRPPAVARVVERVAGTARAHGMFEPGHRVLVCVSGGPDSVCLLESLARLRRLLHIRLEVLHVDHRLHVDSPDHAAYVRRLAARHGLPFHLREAQDAPAPGRSVEEWARQVRLGAAREVAGAAGVSRIAMGHTLDDQAETVLIALITGSGLRGLAGIDPVAPPFVNPLIDVTRDEVVAFCRSLGLRPRIDPSNADTRFLRNAVRLQGLPELERIAGRGLRGPIARTADGLREDARELARRGAEAFDALAAPVGGGVDLDAGGLIALPPAIGGRAAALAVYSLGVNCTRADVDAVLDLAGGRPGRRRDLTGGSTARRGPKYVHLSRVVRSSKGERAP